MLLCLDVGNSHIYGGLFQNDEICLRFRHPSKVSTSDELGVFLKMVLRENSFNPAEVNRIAICSVVPQLEYSLRAACIKYFSITPFFLQSGVKTGLNIKYNNPKDVGADRIANAIAASNQFPNTNLIIIDFGTATTFCVVSSNKVYLGGAILPGLQLAVDALAKNTAKLPPIEIVKLDKAVGASTIESMQSGIFYGSLGASLELIRRIKHEKFANQDALVVATGGFASLYTNHNLYDQHIPDLVLQGVKIAAEMNLE